ncbi:MAG: NERD domain-containing protein, partial [Candidatus Competibacteraceae bacterium]|nr:NERD domain-containing protein [Candidatus Competibacteraceae bacterium]
MTVKAQKKKSPLKAAPLRNPGQSLDEEMKRLVENDVDPYLVVAGATIVLAFTEWYQWFASMPPQPIIYTVIALLVVGIAAFKVVRARRKFRRLKLARDGEKAVGQYLDALREKGYRVLHDMVGDKFNIDHVLIGPAGVFTIETKTISKPSKGQAVIEYDGEHLKVGGYAPDRDPILQGKAQMSWLRELLQETTGKNYVVRSLVMYPGWFVEAPVQKAKIDVLVLNPKVLPSFLAKSETRLSLEDIKLI